MSSDVLLSARDIRKSYILPSKAVSRLKNALLGTPMSDKDCIDVLRGVDIDIRRGETVGILGLNGAGKTTLLSILGGLLKASSGELDLDCKVVTLLGTGSGINKELTGRENAFVFCGLHGMSRKQVKSRIEQIAEFADIGRFFDMPARVYSSGMLARLGFACAAHIDAELIIIDETLAVGDATFRLKCYDHIKSRQQAGQTYLLVSHSQGVVSSFCTRALVLHEGRIIFDGKPLAAVNAYKELRLATEVPGEGSIGRKIKSLRGKHPAQPIHAKGIRHTPPTPASPKHTIEVTLAPKRHVAAPTIAFGIRDRSGAIVCVLDSARLGQEIPDLEPKTPVRYRVTFADDLLPGPYFISVVVHENASGVATPVLSLQNALRLDIAGDSMFAGMVDLDMALEVCDAEDEPVSNAAPDSH